MYASFTDSTLVVNTVTFYYTYYFGVFSDDESYGKVRLGFFQ